MGILFYRLPASVPGIEAVGLDPFDISRSRKYVMIDICIVNI